MISATNFDSVNSKRVSYILATKNRGRFLDKAFKSFRGLVKANDELIVVDGESSDNTLQIVKKYKKIVDLFISERDISESHALNKAILLAKGKYIKQLTDDDSIFPDAMEKAIKIMEKNPETDVLLCGGIKRHNRKSWKYYIPGGVDYGKNCEDVFRYGACGIGIIARRRAFALAGLRDSLSVATDVEFLVRCIYKKLNVKFCRIELFDHPIYSHSSVILRKKIAEKETIDLMAKYCSRKFYFTYRFISKAYELKREVLKSLQKNKKLRRLFFPLIISRGLLVKNAPSKHKMNYLWDGGFS